MSEPMVDVPALYEALDHKRQAGKLSWRGLAQEIGITPSTFTRMSKGRRPDVDTFGALLRWLGMPVETFMRPSVDTKETSEPVAMIGTYLRMDRNLTLEAAEAIEELVRLMYERLRTDSQER